MTWKNFTYDEFQCQCGCGTNKMSEQVIDDLQVLRTKCGFPFRITSGYRCADHPIEKAKSKPGPHNTGLAVDIACSHLDALRLLELAHNHPEWRGFGINQKGAGRFIHLDQCEHAEGRPRPHIWSY